MKHIHILLLCLVCAACGGIDAEDTLSQAESALANGDLELAQANCATLSDTTAVRLTPIQTCRLGLLYCHLYDNTQQTEYAGTAVALFARAGQADSTCVSTFFDSLPIEDQSVMQAISELINTAQCLPVESFETPDEPDFVPANPVAQ